MFPAKQFIFIFFILLLENAVYAQDKQIILSGRIFDSTTKQALHGANITVEGSAHGTISNANGEFLLNVQAKSRIQVSYVGYLLQSIPISSITDPENILIALEKSIINLEEVVVKVPDPLRIIRQAIANIPRNYINKPHISKGFYRSSMNKEKDYIELSEAVFDVYNYGYADKRGNQLRLQKMRAIKDEQVAGDLAIGMKPKEIFEYDAVKNIRDNEIFGEKGLKKYDFRFEGIVDYMGRPAYEISFDQKAEIKESLSCGRVYIDSVSYAFLAFEYTMSPRGIAYAKFGNAAQRMLMQVMDIHISRKSSEHKIRYRQSGDKWVLSSVTEHDVFNFRSSRKNYNYVANINLDYIVTDVDTVFRPPFTNEEILGSNRMIEFQDTGSPGDFWKDYTIILPDFKVEAVAAAIKLKNAQHNLKSQSSAMLRKMSKDPAIRLDSLLAFYNRKGQFNGTALIRHKGQILVNKSYGFSNMDQKLNADSNTLYRIGSLSKSFTAMLICQLANEGKLNLQSPLKTYIPWYRNGNITIEQLLTHQSGIPNYTTNETYLAEIMSRSFSLKDLVIRFCSDSLDFKSGTEFRYSNSGYVILALLAEEVTGKPFGTLIKERILSPLKMNSTYSGQTPKGITNQAIGYYYGKPEPLYNPANVIGPAGITSTSSDLLKYALALHSDKLLPKDKLAELFKPRAEYTDWGASYGYGWMIDHQQFLASKKHKIIYHPGTDIGFYSMFVIDEDTEIILLNNTGDFPRFDIVDLILEEVD